MSYIKNLILLATIGVLSTQLMATAPQNPKDLEERKDVVEAVIEIN